MNTHPRRHPTHDTTSSQPPAPLAPRSNWQQLAASEAWRGRGSGSRSNSTLARFGTRKGCACAPAPVASSAGQSLRNSNSPSAPGELTKQTPSRDATSLRSSIFSASPGEIRSERGPISTEPSEPHPLPRHSWNPAITTTRFNPGHPAHRHNVSRPTRSSRSVNHQIKQYILGHASTTPPPSPLIMVIGVSSWQSSRFKSPPYLPILRHGHA